MLAVPATSPRRPTPYHPPLPNVVSSSAPSSLSSSSSSGTSAGPFQLQIAVKKEKAPMLSPALTPAIVTAGTVHMHVAAAALGNSNTAAAVVMAGPGETAAVSEGDETAMLDDERPPSPAMTQRVREEMDETYRHARLKAKALSSGELGSSSASTSSSGLSGPTATESFYQPRLFTIVEGHVAPPAGTMARMNLRRQESGEFGRRIREEMRKNPDNKGSLKTASNKDEELKRANKEITESSFERQARIVKEQMRVFIIRLKEKEEREKRERLEKAHQELLAKQAAEAETSSATEETNTESVLLAPPAEEDNIVIPEPTDLESCLNALDEGRELSIVSLSALGIGDDGLSQLLEKLPLNKQPRPSVPLTTLILDANDIERRGASLLANYIKTNEHVVCLSLKWNMIGMDGAEALAEALKSNVRLETLQLEGNTIESEGATAIAEALKVNTSLTDLNLKENCIGNVGADALSEALRVNNTLNCLDLTSNGISYAGSNLAEALKCNRGLRFLVLNENSLFDVGASALAEALSENSTLTSLELRDNSIAEEGILALTAAVKCNRTIVDLNVKLNQPGLKGEISLFDLQLSRPNIELIWKDEGVGSSWDPEQCQAIIEHFGSDNVLRLLVEGEGLVPLIDRESLIQHLHIDSTEVAHRFFESLFPESRVVRLKGIEVLIQLLVHRKASSAEAYEMPLAKLSNLLQTLHAKLDWITSMLRQPPSPVIERQAVKKVLESTEVSFGFLRLKILELLPLILELGYEAIDKKLVEASTLRTCLDIFYSNPLNNFIHSGVSNFVVALLKTDRPVLLHEAITNCKLLEGIVTAYREQSKEPTSKRAGYLGHLIKMANEIAAIDSATLQDLLKENAVWSSFVSEELHEANELDKQWSIAKPERPAQELNIGVRSREEALEHV